VPTSWLLDSGTVESTVAWLTSVSDSEAYTGYDAVAWETATWVLHSMYEDPSAEYELTHDDLRRQRIAAGLESPLIVGGVNLDDTTTVIGNVLGMSERPQGVDVVRLRWSDLADRLGLDLDDNEVPPCFRWFPYKSWPVGIYPADEGSLDAESLEALVAVLGARSPGGRSTRCVAYYGALANGGDFDTVWMRGVLLGDIATLVDASEGRSGSPTNWWAEDRSWFVYTDWDLWGTKVSGSPELIEAFGSDEYLETIAWTRPADSATP
jgi:hypothetical protein